MKNHLESELIGMHIGDGTLYKTKWSIVWELRSGLNEIEYYNKKVIPLLIRVFNINITAKKRSGGKNGCYGVQTTNKKIIEFFLQNEFKPGNKTYTIKIPDYIKDSSKHNKLSFVRGYFDTDGCLRFDKNKSNLHKYPRIEFGSASQQMIYDLKELLSELGFKNHIWKDNKYLKLCIAGRVMLEKWIKEVKPKNPKHLNKYHSFRKTGYYATEKQVAQEE